MRKLLFGTVAAFALTGAGSALATVDVLATIDKTKDVVVIEYLTVYKLVTLTVDVDVAAGKFAESLALLNQDNIGNLGCENCAEKRDQIVNSGSSNSGILSINQASGNMNNQGNAIAVSVDVRQPGEPPPPDEQVTPQDDGFAESQAGAEQQNVANTVESVDLFFRDAQIIGSLNGNTGVIHVNQSAGNMANQANALSMSVSFAANGVALSESDLGQFNTGNTVFESDAIGDPNAGIGIHKTALISGSINGNQGIVGVNQSAGHMANQANIVSFAAVLLSN
jgi:hypothetical protein